MATTPSFWSLLVLPLLFTPLVLSQQSQYRVGLLDINVQPEIEFIKAAVQYATSLVNNRPNVAYFLQPEPTIVEINEKSTWELVEKGQQLLSDPSVVSVIGAFTKETTIDEDVLTKGALAPHIGYKADTPVLGNRIRYPMFLRVNPSSDLSAYALMQFTQKMKWARIAILTGYDKGATGLAFQNAALDVGVYVVRTETLIHRLNETEISSALDKLVTSGSTVFVFIVSGPESQVVLKLAAQKGITNSKNGIMIAGDPEEMGLTESPDKEVRAALKGVIGVRWHTDARFGKFQQDLGKYMNLKPKDTSMISVYAGFAHDAVNVLARALDSVGPTDARNGTVLYKTLTETTVDGVTGRVNFDHHGERWMDVDFVNVQDTQGTLEVVGKWIKPQSGSYVAKSCSRDHDCGSTQVCQDQRCVTPNCQEAVQKCHTIQGEVQITGAIVWPDPEDAMKRPTGASTFVEVAVLKSAQPIVEENDNVYEGIEDAIQEINECTQDPKCDFETSNLVLTNYEYTDNKTDYRALLREAGEAGSATLAASVLGPIDSSDYVRQISPIMTSDAKPHIDYGTSASFMEPKTKRMQYPFYVASMPSDMLLANAVTTMLLYNGWTKIAIIYENAMYSRKTTLEQVSEPHNINILSHVAVELPASPESLKKKMEFLKSSGVKVIVCWIDDITLFHAIFDKAEDVNLIGENSNTTWILPSISLANDIKYNGQNSATQYRYFTPREQTVLTGSIAFWPKTNISAYDSFDAYYKSQQTEGKSSKMLTIVSNSKSAKFDKPKTMFARDAVYLMSMSIAEVKNKTQDPLDGIKLVETMRNSNFKYKIVYENADKDGKRKVYARITEININAVGDRMMQLDVLNVDREGLVRTVGFWNPTGMVTEKSIEGGRVTTEEGEFQTGYPYEYNITYSNGSNQTKPKDNLCDYNWNFDVSSQKCMPCPNDTYPFKESSWTCGEKKPPVKTAKNTLGVIVAWLAGTIAFFLVLSGVYYKYRKWSDKKTKDWRSKAAADIKRGWILDIFVALFNLTLEAFDLTTNWIVGFVLIDVRDLDWLNLTIAYFLMLAIATILSIVYLYNITIGLKDTCEDLKKGVNTVDDAKLVTLAQSRVAGDRRASVASQPGKAYTDAKERVKIALSIAKLTLVLAFVEDAVSVAFCLMYMIDRQNITGNWWVLVSLLWSMLVFGQKLAAWKELMFLTEKYAWLNTQHNVNGFQNFGNSPSKKDKSMAELSPKSYARALQLKSTAEREKQLEKELLRRAGEDVDDSDDGSPEVEVADVDISQRWGNTSGNARAQSPMTSRSVSQPANFKGQERSKKSSPYTRSDVAMGSPQSLSTTNLVVNGSSPPGPLGDKRSKKKKFKKKVGGSGTKSSRNTSVPPPLPRYESKARLEETGGFEDAPVVEEADSDEDFPTRASPEKPKQKLLPNQGSTSKRSPPPPGLKTSGVAPPHNPFGHHFEESDSDN